MGAYNILGTNWTVKDAIVVTSESKGKTKRTKWIGENIFVLNWTVLKNE